MKEVRPKALDCSERTKNDIAAAPYNFLFFLDLDKAMGSRYLSSKPGLFNSHC